MISVYVTCRNRKEAEKIAVTLLRKKFIACANIFPVKSMYRWKGSVRNAKEYAILGKSSKSRMRVIEKEIKRVHSYEVPVIVFWNAKSTKEAERWLKGELR